MEFGEWMRSQEMDESRLLSNLGKGLLAGALSLGSAGAASADSVPQDSMSSFMVMDQQKDQNMYYTPQTYQKIVKMAYSGDEWAIREMAWPKGHKFHDRGRPFFKNSAPHPKGLIPFSGYSDSK